MAVTLALAVKQGGQTCHGITALTLPFPNRQLSSLQEQERNKHIFTHLERTFICLCHVFSGFLQRCNSKSLQKKSQLFVSMQFTTASAH